MTAIFDEYRTIAVSPWTSLSAGAVCAASAGFAWVLYLLKTDVDGFIFLDYVNLVFHEAGHPMLGVLGPSWGLYGGTVGQLVFPLIAAASFWRRRDAIGFAVGMFWLYENLLNIARYMADARAQVLPLVGGGEHDWEQIFQRWGVLAADTRIAGMVSTVGWLGMLSIWGWLLWRWRTDRGRNDQSVSPWPA